MKGVLFFGLMMFAVNALAQEVTTNNKDSTVIITRDSKFDEVVAKQKELNIMTPTMHGYRIQIYFGSIRQKGEELKLDFMGKYSNVPAYFSYQQPNYKVRVGDFRTRFEAQKFMSELEGKYPTLFIVPDEVKLPSLK
jgi:hypothetical protein